MSNDNAIVRLLYAILSQKCLKDIDWNKVAHDPILKQEITNGHAARMRYSRFKKQMEGTSAVRRPRNPNSPRKSKVEKNKAPKKIKDRQESEEEGKIKSEAGVAGPSHNASAEGTPEAGIQPPEHEPSPFMKLEPGSSSSSRFTTPLDSPTPGSSFNGGAGDMGNMDEMMTSFGMPTGDGMYHPMMAQGMMGQQHYGMAMHMGMGNPFEELWDHQPEAEASGGVLVKREPRWEEAYRQA